MKQNEDVLTAQIRAELGMDHVPAAVDQRLRQVYAELPEQQPFPSKGKTLPIWLKRTGVALASISGALLVLIGMNGVNPALAESLPFIGGVFETFNRGVNSNNLWETQNGLNHYAMPAGEDTVQVPAGGLGQKPITVSVDQVYYDGTFVYAGLVMELEGCSDNIYSKSWGKLYNISFNGEPQIQWDETTGDYAKAEGFAETTANNWWQKVAEGRYISQRGFRVPEKYQNLERLDVTLCSQGIEDGASGPTWLVNDTPFQLSFTVERNDAVVKKIQGPVEINGITFLSAEAGPAGSTFIFEVSGQYNNPAPLIRFDDGRSLGVAGAGKREKLAGGNERNTWFMGGVQSEEARKVVLSLMDKNDTQEWIAVFVLDFQRGTVEAGTPEDIKDPPYASYVCGTEAVESLTDGLLAARFDYGEEKNWLSLLTGSDYQDLTVELWQDGQRVGSALTQNNEFCWDREAFYMEYVPQAGGTWTVTRLTDLPLHQYNVSFDRLQNFDPARPASVKVMDRLTGEVLLEQDMEWNQPRPGNPKIIYPEVEDSIIGEGQESAVSSQAE